MESLLQKYSGIAVYRPMIEAVKTGNLAQFDCSLIESERLLIKWGTLLLLERIRLMVARTLFKKVYMIMNNQSVIPVSIFENALSVSMNRKCEPDECIVLMCNMIDSGFMKGYISYEKQMVVLKQDGAFPLIK